MRRVKWYRRAAFFAQLVEKEVQKRLRPDDPTPAEYRARFADNPNRLRKFDNAVKQVTEEMKADEKRKADWIRKAMKEKDNEIVRRPVQRS
jgi:hypothetical protein